MEGYKFVSLTWKKHCRKKFFFFKQWSLIEIFRDEKTNEEIRRCVDCKELV